MWITQQIQDSKRMPIIHRSSWMECRMLTHWGRVTLICVSDLTIIGSDNDLSLGRRLAIIGTNIGILLIWPSGTNFSEMLIEMHTFSFKKMHVKMSSAKRRPFCLGLNVLTKARWLLTKYSHRPFVACSAYHFRFIQRCVFNVLVNDKPFGFQYLLSSGTLIIFLAATKQLYKWYFLSVCPSVRLSVTPFWLCSHHRIVMKFSGVITNDQRKVHAKGQGQRSKVKVTEVTTQLNRFRTVTPVWIHNWWWNDAYSLMLLRRGALLFFKVIRQISRSYGSKNRRIWPRLGVSGL